jgi:hypothetical protein
VFLLVFLLVGGVCVLGLVFAAWLLEHMPVDDRYDRE